MSQTDQLIYFTLLVWSILFIFIFYMILFIILIPLLYNILNIRDKYFDYIRSNIIIIANINCNLYKKYKNIKI